MYTTRTTAFVLVNIRNKWVNPHLIAAIDIWRSYADIDSDDLGSTIILNTFANNTIHCEGVTPSQVVEIIRSALDKDKGEK